MSQSSPLNQAVILAEITRGALVESRHRGVIAVVDADDNLISSVGDIDLVSYLRSSAKPHQAIAAIISGAVAHFGLDQKELALMSGSHSGEEYHAEVAASILNKIGLDHQQLRCGIHSPFSQAAAKRLGKSVNELHNNCSGKHAGMLASALMGKHPLENYYEIGHPVQQSIAEVVAQFAGLDRSQVVMAIDGCSAATLGLSIRQMALIYARLVHPDSLAAPLQAAAQQVTAAMCQFPEMVAADTGRIDTDLMRAVPQSLVAKAGAEGVYTMALRPCAAYPKGLGIAIKIEDGDINRARNAATISTLAQLGILTATQAETFAAQYFAPLKNHRGLLVGEIRPAFKLALP